MQHALVCRGVKGLRNTSGELGLSAITRASDKAVSSGSKLNRDSAISPCEVTPSYSWGEGKGLSEQEGRALSQPLEEEHSLVGLLEQRTS